MPRPLRSLKFGSGSAAPRVDARRRELLPLGVWRSCHFSKRFRIHQPHLSGSLQAPKRADQTSTTARQMPDTRQQFPHKPLVLGHSPKRGVPAPVRFRSSGLAVGRAPSFLALFDPATADFAWSAHASRPTTSQDHAAPPSQRATSKALEHPAPVILCVAHAALVTCRSGTPKVRRKFAGSSPQKDPPKNGILKEQSARPPVSMASGRTKSYPRRLDATWANVGNPGLRRAGLGGDGRMGGLCTIFHEVEAGGALGRGSGGGEMIAPRHVSTTVTRPAL
jgi:hypothetical protein